MSSFDRIVANRQPANERRPAEPSDIEGQARATWARDPAIRTEFVSEANYVAYEKARATGKFKILRGNVER